MQWTAAGAQHNADTYTQAPFLDQGYVHTNVTHKRKVGQPIKYVKEFEIRCQDGTLKKVLGGTEKCDGFWTYLRNKVGRKAVNTGKTPESDKRLFFHKLVHFTQWQWNSIHLNRFAIFGSYIRRIRDSQFAF
jgi:hypothetical protein